MTAPKLKELVWVASSLKDLRAFPEEVRQVMGFALYQVQTGDKHTAAKPLRGFGGAGVLEVVEDHAGDTYRAVYTVRFAEAVYVLSPSRRRPRGASPHPSMRSPSSEAGWRPPASSTSSMPARKEPDREPHRA